VIPSHLCFGDISGITKETGERGRNSQGTVPPTQEGHAGISPQDYTVQPLADRQQEDTSKEGRLTVDDVNLDHISTPLRSRVRNLLRKYGQMWDGTLGEIPMTEHHIDVLPGTRPIASAPYRAGPKAPRAESAEVERMLRMGAIEPAQSAWDSPVVLVPKPDGTLRFCVDYRKLNAVTVRDTYPLPRMDECIDSLRDANIFTTLDCNSGYWQVPVSPGDRDKATFVCHSGLFRYRRMSFGLTNAPATFLRTLDRILSGFKWRSCLVYLDEVIIFSKDMESHMVHVDRILSALQSAGVSLKRSKCEFFTDTVHYLGHVIRPETLSVDTTRTAALRG